MDVSNTPLILGAFAGTGLTLGLAGGLAPGPLTALVVSQTVRFGAREGAKVALAPLLTDGPLVLAAALLLGPLADLDPILAGISFVGAAFLTWLAWDAARSTGLSLDLPSDEAPGSVTKSVLTNMLNPHPYLFWGTVGGPVVIEALAYGGLAPPSFLMAFFVAIVGAKVAIAVLVSRFRGLLTGAGYVWTMRVLAAAMLVFAGLFVFEGASRMGWIH